MCMSVTFGEHGKGAQVSIGRASAISLQQLEDAEKSCVSAFCSASKKNSDDSMTIAEGISAAQDVLLTKKLTATASRIMVILSDGESISAADEKTIYKLVPSLQENKVAVFIIRLVTGANGKLDTHAVSSHLLQDLTTHTSGRYLEASNISECLPILASAPGLTVTPRLAKINLQISPALIIPCTYFGLVTKVTLPSLKKQAKPASAANSGGPEMILDNDVGVGVGVGRSAQRDTSYRNPDDPDEEVFAEDRVKGYKYGSQYIPISGTEEEAFKVQGPSIIEVLGFIAATSVPRHHFLDCTTVVQGDAASSYGLAATVSISALSTAMRHSGQVALVRFVKRENGDPIMAALLPSLFARINKATQPF